MYVLCLCVYIFSQLVGSFDTYASRVSEVKRAREMKDRVIKRMQNTALAVAFERYQMSVHLYKTHRAAVTLAISKILHARLAWTFDFWHEATTNIIQKVHEVADDEASKLLKQMLKVERNRNYGALEREAQRRWTICSRTVNRMLLAHLAVAFDLYVQTVAERIGRHAVVGRVLRRMKYQQLTAAFDCYSGVVEQMLAGREAIAQVVSRMQKAKQFEAFENWLVSHQAYRQKMKAEGLEVAKQRMSGEYETEKERIMYTESLQHQMLQDELETARDRYKLVAEQEAQRRLNVCTRVIKGMLAAHLAAAFDLYVQTVVERVRRRAIVHSVLSRMRHMELTAAFYCYSGVVEKTFHQRAVCMKVVRRMLHVRLGVAYACWLDYAQDCQTAAAQQAIHLAKQQMAREMQAYRESVRQENEQKIQHEKTRRMVVCRAMIHKMLHTHLLQAWNVYVEMVSKYRYQRQVMRRVLDRMQHMMLAAAFEGFDTAVDLSVTQREAVAKAIHRWRSPRLRFGFDHMVHFVEIRQREIKEEGYHRATQAMAGELDKTIESNRSVLQHEVEEHEELLQREKNWRLEISRRAVKRMLHTGLSRAFESYRQRTIYSRDRRLLCTKILQRMLQAQVAAAFDGFNSTVRRTKQKRIAITRVISRLKFRSLAKAFEILRYSVADAHQTREDEEWLKAQNEMLTDVLAGTSIGKVLQERTLQDFTLSEAAKEKKVLMVMIVEQENKLAHLERELANLQVGYALWHLCE